MKIAVAVAPALALAAAAAAAALSARAADPTLTLAGPGAGPVVLLLAVAAALAGAGAASWRRRPRSATGPLLLFASVTWSAAQLATPAAPSAMRFTVGLALGAATPAAVALALAPNRRAGAALALASAGLLGVLSALVFDPRASDCTSCPRNVLLVGGSEGLFDALQRAGLWLGLASIGWLLVSCAPRPRLAAVTAYLLAVAVQYTHSLSRGYLAADPTDRALWTLQGLCLLAVAATVAWEPGGRAARSGSPRAARGRAGGAARAARPPRCARRGARRPRAADRLPARRRTPARRRRPPRRARRRPGGDRVARCRAVPSARA